MRDLCSDITMRLLLGVADDARAAAMVAAIRRALNMPGNPPLPVPGDHEGPAGLPGSFIDRAFGALTAPLRGLLGEELRDRRGRGDPGDDVLGAMVSSEPPLSDEEIERLLFQRLLHLGHGALGEIAVRGNVYLADAIVAYELAADLAELGPQERFPA